MKDELQETNDNSISTNAFNKVFSSEAFLIGIIPIIGYLVILSYEYGYYSEYGIPNEFLNFDLQYLFFVINSLKTRFFLLISTYIIFVVFFRYAIFKSKLRWKMFFASIFAERLIADIFSLKGKEEYIFSAIFLSILIILSLILYNSYRRLKGISKNSVNEAYRFLFVYKNEENKYIRILNFLDNPIWFFLVMVTFLLGAFNLWGKTDASDKIYFYVLSNKPECVVLYINKDTALCSPFNRNSKEIDRSVIYKNIGINPNDEFKYEPIGPLKLKPLATATPIPTVTPTQIPITVTPTS